MRKPRLIGGLIALCAALAVVPAYAQSSASPDAGQADPAAQQQIAVASYIHPSNTDAWNRLIESPSDKVTVLVANVLNGPDAQRNEEWAGVIQRAHESGKRVLGYVPTGYLGQSTQRFRTRLGSRNVADWIAQVQQDVNAWYELYGSSIDGIFFDETHNECDYAGVYAALNDYVKRRYSGALTVSNPGTVVPQCYEDTADTLLTFENGYEAYKSEYQDLDWTPKDPAKIWHIVYGAEQANVAEVVELARERGAGYVQVTNDVLANPYDELPPDAYWSAEVAAVSGGTPVVADPAPRSGDGPAPAAPGGVTATGTEYTSTQLSWSAVADAATYNVYLDDELAVTLPASETSVKVGGLKPDGNAYRLQVTAVSETGAESERGEAVTVTTETLPGGRTIANLNITAAEDTYTVSADFLVPYAFHRVFLPRDDAKDDSSPCWTINYNTSDHACLVYLIEGNRFFVYDDNDGDEHREWVWKEITADAAPQVDGYTYTWTFPRPSSGPAVLADAVVVQGEGYGPLTTVFKPCPGTGAQCDE